VLEVERVLLHGAAQHLWRHVVKRACKFIGWWAWQEWHGVAETCERQPCTVDPYSECLAKDSNGMAQLCSSNGSGCN
jgi:hypothetical protein